jgi:hypothetical protein
MDLSFGDLVPLLVNNGRLMNVLQPKGRHTSKSWLPGSFQSKHKQRVLLGGHAARCAIPVPGLVLTTAMYIRQ